MAKKSKSYMMILGFGKCRLIESHLHVLVLLLLVNPKIKYHDFNWILMNRY
jgi:hypothetical protein